MALAGFMEQIYQGRFDRDLFAAAPPAANFEQVERLIGAYQDLVTAYPPSSIEEAGRIPPEMLKRMGEQGFFGLTVPKAYGGMGLGLADCMRIVETVAPIDLSIALVFLAHLFIGIKGIELYGTEDQKRRYLTPAAAGEMIFSYALTEPLTGSDARHIETRADLSPDGGHYILNGTKTYITNANYAGGLTLFAQLDPGKPGRMGAFIVETAWEGVQIGPDMPKMGLKASSTATIRLKDVRVPRENLLGPAGEGFKIALTVLHYGRMGLGAASRGVLEQSVKDMHDRARSRRQFGQPIIEFPLIREKIGKARVHAFVMGAMNDFAAVLLEKNPEETVIETSHCKLFGTTRAWEALYDALQVSGGAGYLATQPYEKRMRDFRVTTIFEGTTEIHSIYPALLGMKQLGDELKKRVGLSRFLFLGKMLLTCLGDTGWPGSPADVLQKKAFGEAKKLARMIRRRTLLGVLVYGKTLVGREFLLRRISVLSLYLFGILSVLAKLVRDGNAGDNYSDDRERLARFLEEAAAACKENKRFRDSRLERGLLNQDLVSPNNPSQL
jgi:acyl-CoA dehydrogenase family member 9